jgi:hypothetical protein
MEAIALEMWSNSFELTRREQNASGNVAARRSTLALYRSKGGTKCLNCGRIASAVTGTFRLSQWMRASAHSSAPFALPVPTRD